MNLTLTSFNINNKFHKLFSYNLFKKKYSVEQYLKKIKDHGFYCSYLIGFDKVIFGQMTVDHDKQMYMHFNVARLRRIVSKIKNSSLVMKKKMRRLGPLCFDLLLEKHPELTCLTAHVDCDNMLCKSLAKTTGFKEKYTVLEFNRNKYHL